MGIGNNPMKLLSKSVTSVLSGVQRGRGVLCVAVGVKRLMAGRVFLLIGLLAISVFSGCVSKTKYEAKEAEVQQLLIQLKNAMAKHGEQSEKEKKLVSESSYLDERMKELEGINKTLLQKNSELTQQGVKLQEENLELKKKLQAKDEDIQKKERELDQRINRMQETYDDLLHDLKAEIEQGNVTVTRLKGELKLNMVSKILFPSGSAELQKSGRAILDKVAAILKKTTDKDIQVQGHTDDRKIVSEGLKRKFSSNWELSAARALTVLKFIESAGVDSARLSAAGFGPHRPVMSNESEEGRQKNRRIEVVLVPRGSQDEKVMKKGG